MTLETPPPEDLRMDAGALFQALRARLPRIGVVTALLLAATFVVLMFVPRLYESSASLLVEDRTSSYTQAPSAGAATPSGGGISIDALLSSQIELVKSRDTLLAVIDSEKLRDVPEFNGSAANPLGPLLSLFGRRAEPKSIDETVLHNLTDRLTVIRERDSAVISIFVRATDPELAARLANAIAAEHVKRRAGQSLADTAEATAWLQQQIETLRAKVQQADAAVADYRAQNGIFAGTNGTTLPDQQMSDITRQITDAQARRGTASQRAQLIRSLLASGQPVEGVEDVRASPVVQSLMQSRAGLQGQLAEKLAILLPAHPTIRSLKAQIAQLDTQIAAEARRVADGLAAQVKVEDGLIASLNDDMARARLAASTQTRDSVTLDSLTREAKAQRDLLESYLIKYRDAAGRTDAGGVLPDVRIITSAAPSVVPASPKTGLILGAVGFVALALQIGGVLFGELMSGRAVYDRNSLRAVEPALAETDAPDATDEPEAGLAPLPEAADEAGFADIPPALATLAADMTLGRARIVLIAALSEARDAALVADTLVAEALDHGLSVCRIDAGSARPSMAPGLTDLCAGAAGFGDVVHKRRDGLAEVPWGQAPVLDRRSSKPLTLVEALADIYEVVIVVTGRVGLNSTLPVFAGAAARLALVRPPHVPLAQVEAAAADIAGLGFAALETVEPPEPEAAVA